MISVLSLKDKEKIKDYFKKCNLTYNENSLCSVAYDNENQIGFSIYYIKNYTIKISDIYPKDDIYLADGIFRSVLFSAANTGVFYAYYDDNIKDFVKKIGFIKNEYDNSIDFEKLFKSCPH